MSAGTLAQQFIDDKREIRQRLIRKLDDTRDLMHAYFYEIERLVLKKMPAGTTDDTLMMLHMGVAKDMAQIRWAEKDVTVIDKSDGAIVYLDNDIARYFTGDTALLATIARKMKKHSKMKKSIKVLEDKLATVKWGG